MKKHLIYGYICLLILGLAVPTLSVFAQTGGAASQPTTPSPSGGSAPAATTSNSTSTPAPTPASTSQSTTPAIKPTTSTKPASVSTPPSTSLQNLPVIFTPSADLPLETEEKSNAPLVVTLMAAAFVLLGLVGIKLNQTSSKDPCDDIKRARDKKEKELNVVKSKLSIQEATIQKIKDEIEKKKESVKQKMLKEGEKKILETVGNDMVNKTVKTAEAVKGVYDSLSEKYDKVNKVLVLLRARKDKLQGEWNDLNSSYNKCMLNIAQDMAPSAEILNPDFFGITNRKVTTLLFLHKPKEKMILLAMKKKVSGKVNGTELEASWKKMRMYIRP